MNRNKTFDDELKVLLDMFEAHNDANDSEKFNLVEEISDWFDENAVYISHLDIGLHQEINKILDDGVITDEEYDTIAAYLHDYLNAHKDFDYISYKKGKQRLTREEIKNIQLNDIGDKDFVGKVVVITGNFIKFPVRKEAEREIRRRGGKTSQSISNVTDIVICGTDAGWRKIEQVKHRNEQGQNIRLVDEETFYKMLEDNEAVED